MWQSQSITLGEIKEVARKFLQLKPDDENMFDIVMATYFANKLDADPLWIFLNGPPSNAKTEILMSMQDHQNTFFLSCVTKNTFLSGRVKKDKDGEEKDCSLLPHMTGKTVIIKDFTTVLSLQKDARHEIYSQFREIYDGLYSKSYGSGFTREWKGKIGVIAGVTPAIDKQFAVHTLLGERFLHFRCGGGNRFGIAKMAMKYSTGIAKFRKELREVVSSFLNKLDMKKNVELEEIQPNLEDKIATLAVFTATARTAVDRNNYTQTLEVFPEPEGPARVAKQFSVLATALAVVRDQKTVTEDEYQIICKLARDSMPKLRFRVLESLWNLYQDKNEWYTTSQVADEARIPKRTVLLKLEDLHLLGLAKRDLGSEDEGGSKPYKWCPSADLVSMADVTGVFAP